MTLPDNPFARYMTAKHGSGIATRSDDTGNHRLSKQVADAYAKTGQAVPGQIASQLQELNDITQQEVMLSKAGAAARGAMSAGAYDPIAIRNRAAELEQNILSTSAEARNAGAAADLAAKQQKTRALEMQNEMNSRTLDAQVNANLSQLSLQAEQNKDALTALEDGRLLKQAKDFAYQTGSTPQELADIYETNDPGMMQEAFGTSDRRVAHQVLQHMHIEESAAVETQLNGMKDAARLQAVQLVDEYAAEDITAMSMGALEIPEGVTQMALNEAMAELQITEQAKSAYATAVEQGEAAGQELNALAVSSMNQNEMLNVMAETLKTAGWTGNAADLKEFSTSGDIAQVAELMLEATDGGTLPIPVQLESGSVVNVPAQAMIEGLAQRQEEADLRMQSEVYSRALQVGYDKEIRETERVLNGVEGLMGGPLPRMAKMEVDALMSGARAAYSQAVAPGQTPEARALLQDEGMRLLEEARETMVAQGEALNLPENQLEDIRQGRFMSDESFGQGMVQMLDAGPNDGLATQAVAGLLRSRGVGMSDIQEFQKEPTVENLNKLGAGVFGGGIELSEIQGAIHQQAFNVLAMQTIAALDTEAFEQLPDPVRRVLDEAVAENGPMADLPAAERYGRFMQAMEVAERMMADNVPDYQRGTLRQLVQAQVNETNWVEELFAPGGKMTRAGAVAATVYMANFRDLDTSGESALAFDQLPAMAARATVDWVSTQERGRQYASMSGINWVVRTDRRFILERAGIRNPVASAGFSGLDANDPANQQYKAATVAIDQALQAVYMRKVIDEDAGRSQIGGVDIPMSVGNAFSAIDRPYATWTEGGIASDDEVIEMLRSMGNGALADEIAAGLRN